MVRVFMAPRTDDRNQQQYFSDQRRNMIELDKFVANCELMIKIVFFKLYFIKYLY